MNGSQLRVDNMVSKEDFKPQIKDGKTLMALFGPKKKGARTVIYQEEVSKEVLKNDKSLQAAKTVAFSNYATKGKKIKPKAEGAK